MNGIGSEIIKTLSDGIDMLAKKLGVAADKIYPVLIKQAKFQMYADIMWVIIGVGLIIFAIILTKMFIKSIKTEGCMFYKNWHGKDDEGAMTVFAVIGLVALFIISVLIFTSNVQEIMQIAMNPDWYIFENMIKPLISK